MRGREAWTQSAFRTQGGQRQPVVDRALPREDGTVRVRLEAGRGNADVLQQPSRRNDYTAVIRIRDQSNGSDIYRVTAYWMDRDGYGDDGWDRGGNGRNGPNDGWGRNDRFDQSVLRWSGRVDDDLEIRIQDNRIEYRNLSGKGTRDVHAELTRTGLPRDGSQLRVESWTARGDVIVVQQPSARNGYTAVIRIRDPQPSYGFYDFTLSTDRRYGVRGNEGRGPRN